MKIWELEWCELLFWFLLGLKQQRSESAAAVWCILFTVKSAVKYMDKFVQILRRHQSFYPGYIFNVIIGLGWLRYCLSLAVEMQDESMITPEWKHLSHQMVPICWKLRQIHSLNCNIQVLLHNPNLKCRHMISFLFLLNIFPGKLWCLSQSPLITLRSVWIASRGHLCVQCLTGACWLYTYQDV